MSRTATDFPSPQNSLGLLRTSQRIYSIQVPCHTVALDILQSKNAVAQVIFIHSYHSLQLVKVTSVSLSCSLCFLNYFISSFFSSHGVLSPPLSTSPASKFFCRSIWTNFAKLLPSFSTFTLLFETYAAFTQFDSTCFLQY